MVEIIGPYFEILILELIDMTIEKKEERGLGGSNFLSAQFRRIKSQLKMLSLQWKSFSGHDFAEDG